MRAPDGAGRRTSAGILRQAGTGHHHHAMDDHRPCASLRPKAEPPRLGMSLDKGPRQSMRPLSPSHVAQVTTNRPRITAASAALLPTATQGFHLP